MANKADKEKMLEEIEDRVRTIGVLTSGGDAPGMKSSCKRTEGTRNQKRISRTFKRRDH